MNCLGLTGTHTQRHHYLLLYELPGSNCRQCTRRHKYDDIIPTWFLLLNWTPPQAEPLCEQGRYKHSIFSPHTMDLVVPQYRAHDPFIFPQCRHKHSNTSHLCTPGLSFFREMWFVDCSFMLKNCLYLTNYDYVHTEWDKGVFKRLLAVHTLIACTV